MTARKRQAKKPPINVEHDGVEFSVQPEARSDLYSTFRVGGPTDYLVRASGADEIAAALGWAAEEKIPVTVFGGGSNMLIGDRGIRGLMLLVRKPGRDAAELMQVLDEDDGSVTVRVPAAAPLNWLARTACENGWDDMTWAVGLPGNVGGATVNNAGAHGTEMKDHLLGLRAVDATGQLVEHDRDWMSPTYRRTRLKAAGNPRAEVVLDVTLKFARGDSEELRQRADQHAAYRHETQPTGACAGSIFKNPEGTYSGVLVEQCNLKGTRVGGAVVSPKHANFIVNDDGATAADIVELISLVQQRVLTETGITLETEIERVGEW